MKFKDVAHLYIGCKIDSSLKGTLLDGKWYQRIMGDECDALPILYPLSAMTKKQMAELKSKRIELSFNTQFLTFHFDSPESLKYLLDNHFDIYNLIESGEAIDVTTLEKNPYDAI